MPRTTADEVPSDPYYHGPTHYEILQIPTNATDEEIQRGYRRKLLLYHPDKVQRLSQREQEDARIQLLKIEHSRDFLLSLKRCAYDNIILEVTTREQSRQCVEDVIAKESRSRKADEEQRRADRIREQEARKEEVQEEMQEEVQEGLEEPQDNRLNPNEAVIFTPWKKFLAILVYVLSLVRLPNQ
ncbi:hypothetical protein ONZ43_g1788 [Nemania bipapillata]|uniref:Uncharacterized protein n=1 Tax=Nemania bipapillata TaxID=110536 RepID=A0ACC2J3V7_9PEZI|nr:hypothetical protein ONZ43_g1788 [Nemania bipapillata]